MSFDEMPDHELWDLTNGPDLAQRSDALIELGQRKIAEEDFNMAKTLFGSAADLLVDLDREVELTRAIYSAGYCQYRLGESEEAIKTLSEALQKSQDMGDARSIAYSAGTLGDSYSQQDRDDEAIAAFEIAVDAFLEFDEYFSAGINVLSMGELHGKHARQTKALECFIRAFNIFQGAGDAFGAARAKDRMATALVDLNDLDQALMHIKDALNTFAHLDAEDRVAYMNYRLGKVLVLAERYHKAIAPLREAIAYYREKSDWMNAAYAEMHLANALRLMDPEEENAESERLLERLRSYFEAAGAVSYSLVIQTIQGDKLSDRGQLEGALAIFQDVVERAAELEDQELVMSAKTSVAELLFKLGRQHEGREVLTQVDSTFWGENKRELDRLEAVMRIMFASMANTLNIEVVQ